MSYVRVMLMAALVLGVATVASAQPIVKVDEFGKAEGDVTFLGLMSDPTDGYLGGPVLVYQLPFPVVPGDLRAFEPSSTGVLSDVIRFTPNGQMVFYSDGIYDGLDAPADILWPLEQLNPNPYSTLVAYRDESGQEGGYQGILYVPTANEPGSFPTGALGVQYTFISDTPEPATLTLLALGGLGALLRRKRR